MEKGMIPVLAASQFDPGVGRVEMTLPEGMTVADIVAAALPGATVEDLRRCRVAMVTPEGSSIIDPAYWSAIRPKPGVQIVIRLVPGKGALRAILSIVVAIAAVALGTIFGPAVGAMLGFTGAAGAALGSAIVGMGVNLIGSLLINALVPPVRPDPERIRNTYSISGWRNRIEPDGAVPVVMGSIRYAPPFAARPYTEIVGDWQYLRSLFVFGEGPLELSDFRIGETALSEFDEVQIEVRAGFAGALPVSIYPRQVVEEAIGVELTRPLPRNDLGDVINGQPATETPVIRTTGADARGASVILAFPAGLIRYNDEGRKRTQSVRVRIQQRLAGASAWQLVTTLDLSAKKAESFYRQHTWNFPQRGRWEIRLTMMTAENDDSKVQQRTVWAALQTLRPEYPLAYDRALALVAVRVKATHQLSGALDNFSALVSRICADWDHVTQTWVARTSSNPASLFRAALQHPSNPKAVPNAGIDLQQLQDWHDFCRIKGLSYNRVLEQAGTSLRDVLTEIAAAGRATPRHDGIRWGVVIDRPSELIVDHVSPRNSWDFSCRRAYSERPQGLIVRFQDQTNDFKETQRVIPRPGYTGSVDLTEVLELPGITNPAAIYREAARRMFEAQHRPDIYEVTQDGAARVATRGDTIMISHDVLSSVQTAARVLDVRGDLIMLDEEVTMRAARNYGVRFRRITAGDTVGSSEVRTVATAPGTTNLLTLTGSGPTPVAGDLILFGIAGQESVRAIVTGIEATEGMGTILRAVDAAPQIDTLTDALVIPPWSGRAGAEIAENFIAPPAPRFAQVASEVSAEAIRINYLIEPGSGLIGASTYQVEHRLAGAGSWTVTTIPAANGGGAIDSYSNGQNVQIRARAISATGVEGPYGPVVVHQVGSGGVGIPAALDAESVTVTALLGGGRIEFVAPADANLARVRLYRSTSAVLNRATDGVGQPLPVVAGQTHAFAVGDTTRTNLLRNGGWSAGDGWSFAAGTGTHTGGTAGDLTHGLTLQAGRWYRIGLTISGRTAGNITPRLTGGAGVDGTPVAANASHRQRLQAIGASNGLALQASAPFDGSVSAMAAYLETAACLSQGTHYLWLEPQSEDGLPGPVIGPFTLDIV